MCHKGHDYECVLPCLPSPSDPDSEQPPSATSITTLPTLKIPPSHHPRRRHHHHPFSPPSTTPHSHQLPPHCHLHPLLSSSRPLPPPPPHPPPVFKTTTSAGMS